MDKNPKSYCHLNIFLAYRPLIKLCKQEYIKYHPEFSGVRFTDNKIFFELAKYYLKDTEHKKTPDEIFLHEILRK